MNTTRTSGNPFYLGAGVHTVSLHKYRYLPGEAEVTIIAGESTYVSIPLTYNPKNLFFKD